MQKIMFSTRYGLEQATIAGDKTKTRREVRLPLIAGYVCALLFMPSLKVAMFIWGMCCAIDNIGWLVVYHRNREKFLEIKQD